MRKSWVYRKIYREHHGPIPKGCHIHHIDGDKTNNDPDNLVAIEPFKHWLIHYCNNDSFAINGKFIQGASEAGKRGGAKSLGKKASQETRKKLSEAQRGEKNFWYGKHLSEERKEKLRQANLGKKQSEETIAKRVAKTTGQKRTPEQCDAQSKRSKGENNPMFGWTSRPDYKKIVEKQKLGRAKSERARKAFAEMQRKSRDRTIRPETREKLRNIALRRWEKWREKNVDHLR